MNWFSFFKKNSSKTVVNQPSTLDISDSNFQVDLWTNICEYLKQFPDKLSVWNELQKLPFGVQMVYSTIWLESEVQNGGFNQYFWNKGSGNAQLAVKGYKAIGAKKLEKLITRADEIYNKEFDSMKKLYSENTAEAFSESYESTQLTKLDDKFYDIFDANEIEDLRQKYIKTHLDEFQQFRDS